MNLGGASPPETVKRVVYNAGGGVKSNSPIVSKVIHSWHGVSETIGVFKPLDGLEVDVDGSSRAWTNHCRSWRSSVGEHTLGISCTGDVGGSVGGVGGDVVLCLHTGNVLIGLVVNFFGLGGDSWVQLYVFLFFGRVSRYM